MKQEMGLMLCRNDAVKVAIQEWNSKWVPAILKLSESLTGNPAAVFKHNQRTAKGSYL